MSQSTCMGAQPKTLKAPFPAVPLRIRGQVFGRYFLSEDGQVWSEFSRKLLRPYESTTGYLYVDLRINGKTERVMIHQAVAETYIGERPIDFDTCHNDGNRKNNSTKNLRYASRSENLSDRDSHGTHQRGQQNPAAKLTDLQAEEIIKRRQSGERLADIARSFNVRESTVSRIANGVRRTKNGGTKGNGAAQSAVSVDTAFGGKSRVADEVWRRLGEPRNFIEPFAFSAAVLLKRPGGAGPIETINDLNGYVANFWRAVQQDPEAVAAHADWPVNETDLHSRHRWLVTSDEARHKLQAVMDSPDAYDARMAGWWAWGACCWIGSGWCETRGVGWTQMPELQSARGVAGEIYAPNDRQPALGQAGWGLNAAQSINDGKRPGLCNGNTTAGPGVLAHVDQNRPRTAPRVNGWMPGVIGNEPDDTHRPQLADAFARGRGVNSNDAAETCRQRREWLIDWMRRLADRLRPVRVCCGHWARVCDSDSTMTRLGLTGVFLDPPYRKSLACGKKNRSAHIYANDKSQDVNALCNEVQEWCLRWGEKPDVRIALCGYEGEYPAIEAAGWTTFAWKAQGGYGNRTAAGKENADRERVWFNKSCINPSIVVPTEYNLFGAEVA